ncbi:hypothetical protein ABZV77_25080 [Streptomyces sp. NPDC004732]|uniref:hypothetical protein n=1 Tax=Streptomyces sp. NPDC004732 TaxID=3154290 RepID=UPI0033A2CD25
MKASWAGRRATRAVAAVVAGVITLVGAALLAVLAAGVPALAAYATESASGPAVGSTVTTVDETSRAGSSAGEGRERPGGAQPPILDPPPVPYTPPPATPPPRHPRPTPAVHRDTASDLTERTPVGPVLPNLRVLPLGGGLVLIGLGLGFLGLRLRRG